MPDFKVTFKGDLGNAAQFYSALKNSAVESSRQIENVNTRVAASVGKISGQFSKDSGAGLFTTKAKTDIDAYNKTMIQTTGYVKRAIKDYEILQDKAGNFSLKPIFDDTYFSTTNRAIGDLDKYEKALKRVSKTERQIEDIRLNTRQRQLDVSQRIATLQNSKAGSTSQLSELINNSNESNLLREARKSLALLQNPGKAFVLPFDLHDNIEGTPQYKAGNVVERDTIEGVIKDLRNPQNSLGLKSEKDVSKDTAQADRLTKLLGTPQGELLAPRVAQYVEKVARFEAEIAKIGAELQADITKTQAEIDQLKGQSARIDRAGKGRETRARNKNPGYAQLNEAANAIPPIQKDLATVLAQSKELRKNLISSGLGGGAKYGTEQFRTALASQEAGVARYTENIRTGLRTIQGAFKDLNTGMVKEFTADIDQNGKVVGRWGGQLRGAGTFIKQTVRDFQKVVEWTVATTVVFGALATVVGQLKNINDLNTSLTRFSITAQTTTAETSTLFKQLSQVAFDTATPLNDIVKVADDIALATRAANQSTEEWHSSIIDLTTAVGIFTNLTGKDTVQSADLLSAAFKQLNIAPAELIGILNKVTAVAGGQANAIADILQSIGGLAEAAKAAGFTIDEQIASVQVLAQVTNKTSDEIATSFKNLFGSVSSVGSVKILEQFGISVRESNGDVRDFLDIYRDVKKALEQGIIPKGRLPDVLRGISGGPRRAPDAAALLANLDKIDEVIGKSLGASNEALIANAKVLDSNQAKLVQFKNAFDTAVFEKFGESVKVITERLTDFGISFFNIFNSKVSGEILTALTQLLLFAGGFRILGAVARTVLPSISSINKGYKGLKETLIGLTKAQHAYVTDSTDAIGRQITRVSKGSAPIIVGGKPYLPGQRIPKDAVTDISRKQPLSRNAKIGGLIGLGASVVAIDKIATSAAKGTLDVQALGGALQVAGGLATLLPGIGTAVGIAGIAVGTALQFIAGESDKTKKSTAELSGEVYTLIQSLQATQVEIEGYLKTQKASGDIIDKLAGKTNKTVEEQSRLTDATNTYVEATLSLATANQTVSKTFDEILSKIPGLVEKYQRFKDIISTGRVNASSPFIAELEQQLADEILRASGQGIYAGKPLDVAEKFRPSQVTGGTTVITSGAAKGTPGYTTTDLADIAPIDLIKIFGLDRAKDDPFYGKETYGGVPRNEASLALLQSNLGQLITQFNQGSGEVTQEQLDELIKIVLELSKTASSFTQNSIALTQQAAGIQSKIITGKFDAEQGTNATLANTLAQRLNLAGSLYERPVGPSGLGGVSAIQTESVRLVKSLSDAANKGLPITNKLLEETAINSLKLNQSYDDLAIKGEQALGTGIIQWLQKAGVEQEILNQLAAQYNLTAAQTIALSEELVAGLDAARTSAQETYGKRALQLLIAENSGDFEGNISGLKALKAQNLEARDSTLSLIDSIGDLSRDEFVDLNNALSQVIGMQGEYISQTQLSALTDEQWAERQAELAQKLIEGAVAAGVNAEGIERLTVLMSTLTNVINNVPSYKSVIIDIQQIYSTKGAKENLRPGYSFLFDEILKKGEEAEADRLKIIKDTVTEAEKIFGTGKGSNFGALPKTAPKAASKPYNKPGLLDIPEEVADAATRDILLKQAIQTAKDLQAKIPGETKENKDDIVALLDGTKKVLETRGIGEEYLRRAMDELRDEIKKQNDLLTKADTIRRIRIGSGDFAAIANVPLNSQSGVSVGSPDSNINVTLNISGQVLTPASMAQLADQIGASIKRQLGA